MSEQIFPNVELVLDILMGELPSGVYSTDRADSIDFNKRSYSSSELRAHAEMFGTLYENLAQISADKFVSTVTPGGIGRWENQLFTAAQDSSLPFETRKANLITKYRFRGGISRRAITLLVSSILTPVGLTFEIITLSGGMNLGAWILDYSELDVATYLAKRDPLWGAQQDETPLDCDLDWAAAGITEDDLLEIQETAYTYEVRIFGTASPEVLATLDSSLTINEKGGSTHRIVNNFPLPIDPDLIDMGAFSGDTLIDSIKMGLFRIPGATYDVWDFGGF